MYILPAIRGKTLERPGPSAQKNKPYLIPNLNKYEEFWDTWYLKIEKLGQFVFPVQDAEEKINPFFGYFGNSWHPVNQQANYYNVGISISDAIKTPIRAVSSGVLEHSGYGVLNGNYIMLSHPHIATQDGYVLHSLYMHLKEAHVYFSKYQKMLRQISLNTHPQILVNSESVIGDIGNSGNTNGRSYLHLQTHLVHPKDKQHIAVDPARVLGIRTKTNITAGTRNLNELRALYDIYGAEIQQWKIEDFFKYT